MIVVSKIAGPSEKSVDLAERAVARLGPWRYLQFLVVGGVIGGLAYGLSGLGTWPSIGVGVVGGLAYFGLEKWRGVI